MGEKEARVLCSCRLNRSHGPLTTLSASELLARLSQATRVSSLDQLGIGTNRTLCAHPASQEHIQVRPK